MLLEKSSSEEEPLQRIIYVIWYLISSFGDFPNAKKPFNPILGETFQGQVLEGQSSSNYATFVAEQVKHHPPTSALAIIHKDFHLCVNLSQEASFWGKHLKVNNVGKGTISLLGRNEIYEISRFPNLYFRFFNWRSEWKGKLKISCPSTGYTAIIHFKEKKLIGGEWDQVDGRIYFQNSKNPICNVTGIWSKSVSAIDVASNKELSSYQFSSFTPLSVSADSTDERSSFKVWEKVTTAIQNQDANTASEEKKRIENEQRERNSNGSSLTPSFFNFDSNFHLWKLKSQDNPS